ncbi:hypothetical protein F9U64_14305 [Gracilibacillus oryzae]|uniref:N-acetyltransferase domain-containing protein n=1 Tax=Gracilibacillus oryzae TaxID=1672701 RepID=A0A7C8GSC7_9BACI|nr:hypothetical protein [Gracilibacillus oryzae]KAB8130513.1 hypothetical protein F9U64_14305 [Gracilibacillus oryzae]
MAQFQPCSNDTDLAKVSLFLLENRHELHPSFTTLDMVSLIYSYATQGQFLQVRDSTDQVIGAAVYYHGTPDQEFKNSEVAFVDIAVFAREVRGTRAFLNGLQYMINHIASSHPEVKEVQFAAYAENNYVCKLYSKFMDVSYLREGKLGKEIIYYQKILNISTFLKKFNKI